MALALVLAGCDSSGSAMDDGNGSAPTQSATVSGQVTNSPKATRAKDGVEGATVTAVSVDNDGSTIDLDGEATTNADGTFDVDLEGDGAQGIVLLTAEDESSDFTAKVLVKVDGEGAVQAPPMTAETTAEAAVYLEGETQDGANEDDADGGDSDDDDGDDSDDSDSDDEVREDADGEDEQGMTVADVAAYVDAELAAQINGGAVSASNVAQAIVNGVDAEAAFIAQSNGAVTFDGVEEEKESAYLALQSDLVAAADADARADAKDAFEARMADVHARAGATVETQAKIRQAATTTAIKRAANLSTAAQSELRQKAEILRADATAQANEARFEAAGAASASVTALEDARVALLADIRANADASVSAIEDAKATYVSVVKAEMENGLNATSNTITAAEESISATLSTLQTTVNDDPQTTTQAYATFYANAETTAESTFTTNATASAKVLVLTEAF